MSEFVLSGSDVFGKYCLIETGRNREKHIYKAIQSLKSNYYRDAPLYCGMDKETNHNSLDDVLLVIHCGIDETEVIKVAAKDAEFIMNETEKETAELEELLREALVFLHWSFYGNQNDYKASKELQERIDKVLEERQIAGLKNPNESECVAEENKKLRRLLKTAVDDISFLLDTYSRECDKCKYDDESFADSECVNCENAKWVHYDEAMKLLEDKE